MEGAECATAALRNLAEYYEFRKTLGGDQADSVRVPAQRPELPSGILPTAAAFRLLESFGIPVTATALAQSANDAVVAAERMGFPVALKVESPQIAHKSDAGGVALGISSVAQVREAFNRICQQVSRRAPGATIQGAVVQQMASAGVEMILGIKRDPMFGPVVLCGFGGVLVELLQDVAIGIPPLSKEQARAMISRLRGFAILGGVRGKPPADLDALCEAIIAVSRLAVSLGDRLDGLDINPLIVQAKGVVAVDALVQIV
jgi:acetyltransferase